MEGEAVWGVGQDFDQAWGQVETKWENDKRGIFFQKDNFNFKELRRRAEISRRGWEMQETWLTG